MSKVINYNKLNDLFIDDISLKLRGSFAILLSNYIDISSENYWNSKFYESAEIKEIRKSIISSIASLSDVIKTDELPSKTRDEWIDQYISHKKQIGETEKVLQSYIVELNFYKHILKNLIAKNKFQDTEDLDLNMDGMIKDCISFVENAEWEIESAYKISKIMACLPIKMTRLKYFDYIRESIKSLKSDNLTLAFNYVNDLEEIFKACIGKSDADIFPEIGEKLKGYRKMSLETLSLTELTGILDEIDDIIGEISTIFDYLLIVFESVNSLLIIYTFVDDMDYLMHDDFTYKDAYYFIKESIDKPLEEIEPFSENIVLILNNRLDSIVEKIYQLNIKNEKFLKSIDWEKIPKKYLDITKMRNVLTEIFYENISDIGLESKDKNTNNIDDNSLSKKVESFITFIEESLQSEIPKKQRFIKQIFIGFLFSPFNGEEFVDYLVNALKFDLEPIQQKVISINILDLFEESGFEIEGFDDFTHNHNHDCNHHEHGEHCCCHKH